MKPEARFVFMHFKIIAAFEKRVSYFHSTSKNSCKIARNLFQCHFIMMDVSLALSKNAIAMPRFPSKPIIIVSFKQSSNMALT